MVFAATMNLVLDARKGLFEGLMKILIYLIITSRKNKGGRDAPLNNVYYIAALSALFFRYASMERRGALVTYSS